MSRPEECDALSVEALKAIRHANSYPRRVNVLPGKPGSYVGIHNQNPLYMEVVAAVSERLGDADSSLLGGATESLYCIPGTSGLYVNSVPPPGVNIAAAAANDDVLTAMTDTFERIWNAPGGFPSAFVNSISTNGLGSKEHSGAGKIALLARALQRPPEYVISALKFRLQSMALSKGRKGYDEDGNYVDVQHAFLQLKKEDGFEEMYAHSLAGSFSTMDMRNYHARGPEDNVLHLFAATRLRKGLKQLWNFTFDHRELEHLNSKIRTFLKKFDFSRYDQSIPGEVMPTLQRFLRTVMPSHLHWAVDTIAKTRLIYTHPNESDKVYCRNSEGLGLPSGIAYTDVVGKVYFIATMKVAMKWTWVQMDKFLRGDMDTAAFNSSDDTLFVGDNEQELELLANTWRDFCTSLGHEVEFEHPLWMGNIYNTMTSKFQPRILATVANLLNSERGFVFNSKARGSKRPGSSMLAKLDLLNGHDGYRDARDALNIATRMAAGMDVEDYAFEWFKYERKYLEDERIASLEMVIGALTVIELEVMAQPDKLWWKYEVTDVRKEVLDTFGVTVPGEAIQDLWDGDTRYFDQFAALAA